MTTERDDAFVMRLELVPVPVSDLERSKAFYVEKLGFNADHDTKVSETVRAIQLTPQGSACSIVISTGLGEISEMQSGSLKGLHLVVKDIEASRNALIARGVEVAEIIVYPREIKFASFRDPDGNLWTLQEIPPNL